MKLQSIIQSELRFHTVDPEELDLHYAPINFCFDQSGEMSELQMLGLYKLTIILCFYVCFLLSLFRIRINTETFVCQHWVWLRLTSFLFVFCRCCCVTYILARGLSIRVRQHYQSLTKNIFNSTCQKIEKNSKRKTCSTYIWKKGWENCCSFKCFHLFLQLYNHCNSTSPN